MNTVTRRCEQCHGSFPAVPDHLDNRSTVYFCSPSCVRSYMLGEDTGEGFAIKAITPQTVLPLALETPGKFLDFPVHHGEETPRSPLLNRRIIMR